MRKNLQPLETKLVELSQRCYGTRWYNGFNWYGYAAMERGPMVVGRAEINAHDVTELRQMHQELGGWMLYPLQMPAYVDTTRWRMWFGGGPNVVIENERRLERKLQIFTKAEMWSKVDGFLQGTEHWF